MVRIHAQRVALIISYMFLCAILLNYRGFPQFEKLRFLALLQRRKDAEMENYRNLWPQENITPDLAYDRNRLLRQLNFMPEIQNRTFRIFLPHGFDSWYLGKNQNHFEGCAAQNCLLSERDINVSDYDAILFRNTIESYFAKNRNPEQIWIWYTLEAPVNLGSLPEDNATFVNWTATYRYSSDIPAPYGFYMSGDQLAEHPHVRLRQEVATGGSKRPRKQNRRHNYAKRKSKLVAWMVSNCFTTNGRLQYAKRLAEHAQVDIYGFCGMDNCSKRDPHCWQMLDEDYKFYLAFENANCDNYVTEKFFEVALGHDIVPIVMGAPKEFYEAIAPRHSFIHVDDFASPKHLADYLHYLDRNDDAYNAYLAWKQEGGGLVDTQFMCRLCALLNQPMNKQYVDINQWWNPKGTCQDPSTDD